MGRFMKNKNAEASKNTKTAVRCHHQEQDSYKLGAPAAKAGETIGYTCPMHSEIRQPTPGACSICGMALEPVAVAVIDAPNPEYIDMCRRFWVALILTFPVFVMEMSGHRHVKVMSASLSIWIQMVLATPVVLWGGLPFFQRGINSFKTHQLNMFTLISIGIGVAWGYSMVATLFPGIFPFAFRREGGVVAVYFEAAAVITTLVLLGQVLELKAREQTGSAIRALLKLAPDSAHRVSENGRIDDVSLDDVQQGDLLRVLPGEKVPVDGVVEAAMAFG